MGARDASDPLAPFHPAVRAWFTEAFGAPTRSQAAGWPAIARGESAVILAPTGSGKTLAAFLWCLDRLMFAPRPAARAARCRAVYVSPLKALAVDVERNLRVPLAGIARTAAARGEPYVTPAIAVRTGDTPAAERARFQRDPADLLITTPESLYLLLTANARDVLRGVQTVIVDEIHALVPTKRGAHLALTLERLAAQCEHPPQRIGLSATQRPLDEVARFLGGAERASVRPTSRPSRTRSSGAGNTTSLNRSLEHEFADADRRPRYRPVTIVDAGARKALRLRIEIPLEPAHQAGTSIWTAIHPRLLALIREHRSTLLFVNSRRLAERIANALNELAGEILVRSHHGSIARAQRSDIEEQLKAGGLRGLVATSALELGIDMGAIDLVIQIEAPPTVASGLQRIGRSGHRINATSEGIIFPKFRGDLVACAAVAKAMHDGAVEASRYPRNPLDILAQQIVATLAMDDWAIEDLYAMVRQAAPFAALARGAFEGVLDMLSGRYPSDEFAELRPRITWDRAGGRLAAREGARRVAVINGGTIPDRGLYGVFLAGAPPGAARVGELDEEMVFESRVGETFVLGASSWRIEEITHDRVLVSPAPGEPGKMPFWKGDRAGRPLDLGLAIGRLMHTLSRLPHDAAVERLVKDHDLDPPAAAILLSYLREQIASAGALPDAGSIIVESVRDDMGDWRVCVLSPRGGRVHAPWAMAAAALIRERTGIDVATLWGDDGFVVRFPNTDRPPDPELVVPDPDAVQALVVGQLGATALFAGKFRENAARSLLLPKRRPGMRAPLWQQRKRAADLLAVASRFGSFPVLLETYRECLRDFFDIPALVETLRDVRSRKIRVVAVNAERPSPFAASLLFDYVASFLYDGDAPLAERRAQALVVDQAQLRELIGDAELRELLDSDALRETEQQLQRHDPKYHVRSLDSLHDLLLSLGDMTGEEIQARSVQTGGVSFIQMLVTAGRAVPLGIAGETRYVAVEHAARYRDALGITLPPGIPAPLLEPPPDPLGDLALLYARTHGPFTVADFLARYQPPSSEAEAILNRLTADRRLLEGEFRPGGAHREWIDPDVLGLLRRRSLARLRREIEPADHAAFGRFIVRWQGIGSNRRGPDTVLDTIEQLQGAPLPASILESEILPARVAGYDPGQLDALLATGEVVWVGVEPLGERDGLIALYLADRLQLLLPPRRTVDKRAPLPEVDPRERAVLGHLRTHGASFFGPLHEAAGGGYPAETVRALWDLVWQGLVTNDSLHALRAFTRPNPKHNRRLPAPAAGFRSRRLTPPAAEGRWSLVPAGSASATAWTAAFTQQLLARHGVITRESVAAESPGGGFTLFYPVLKALEENGRIRRGYFVAGLGATQFALPGALDMLRSLREPEADVEQEPNTVLLSATDPANPYGATLAFPPSRATNLAPDDEVPRTGRGPTRSVGATVVIARGALVAYLARGDRSLTTWIPREEPARSRTASAIAVALMERARGMSSALPRGLLIEEIDAAPAAHHILAPHLVEAGFVPGAMGFHAPALQ